MSSERRIRASRENGARSCGPKTPEGKRRSSLSSLRHGILAQTIVLAEEDGDAFSKLLRSFETEFVPRTPNEAAMIENLAVARWRLMRVWGLEKEGFSLEIDKFDPAMHAPATRAAMAFRALSDESRTLDLLHRYETRYDRLYHRALNQFHKSREKSNLPNEPSPVSEQKQ